MVPNVWMLFRTCTELGLTCGPASNGCGGTLSCGTCTAPTACGGGGKPGVCGCTGTCSEIPACSGSATTTLSGHVYDPADLHPLYNVLVYIPNNPTDPNLTSPFPAGVTCDQCSAASSAAGQPLISANSAYDGSFTLTGVPVGSAIPIVIQNGRWRRQFTVNIATACGSNTITASNTTPVNWLSGSQPLMAASGHLTFPTSSTLGDIPRIAILSGSYDMVECELRKLGIADTEFVNPGAWGQGNHVQFYAAADPTAQAKGWNTKHGGYGGTGALISASTPAQTQLFGTDATTGHLNINQYDLVINECEGYQETEPAAQQAALATYVGIGGRLFASDFAYDWLFQNPTLEGAANWGGNNSGCGFAVTGTIDPAPTNPTGTAFQDWLQFTGVSASGSGTVSIDPAFPNVTSVNGPTVEWLYTNNSEYDGAQCGGPDVPTPIPIHFTFNTPIGAAPAQQCGLVTFSDWHASSGFTSQQFTFPNECKQNGYPTTMTDQETILEFMLFDATSCVTPYQASCVPLTCTQQGISCGPAGDGCGNLIASCGTCTGTQTCGGGGSPGVCGSSACVPGTCASEGFNCGEQGDGCGGTLSCGTCTAPEDCGGGGTPGVCGGLACQPTTCANLGFNCGPAGDGCGGLLECGTCSGSDTCGGSGSPGVCGSDCIPKTCAQLGFNCGPAGDGCGGVLTCGNCSGSATCGGGGTPGVCGVGSTCTAETCSSLGFNCGPAGNGCGGELSCGTCTSPQTCGGGGKPGVCGSPSCTPATCMNLGINCGPAGDGCGGQLSCGTCTAPQSCGGGGTPGVCGSPGCTPTTCGALGVNCGDEGDGCGGLLSCGSCTSPQTCGGGGTPGVCGNVACTPETCTSQGYDCGEAGNGCGGTISCGTCTGTDTCGGGGQANVCGNSTAK